MAGRDVALSKPPQRRQGPITLIVYALPILEATSMIAYDGMNISLFTCNTSNHRCQTFRFE